MKRQAHLNAILMALLSTACVASVHAAPTDAPADDGVYAALGPFGVSVGYEHRFGAFGNGHWGSRVLVNSGSLGSTSRHDDVGGNRYDTRLKTGAGLSTLLDYYPSLDSGWRVTGGVILSKLKTDLTGQPDAQGNYNLNGHSYSAAQVGTLTGRAKYGPALVYLGGGWESAAAGAKGWRFVSDAGLFVTDRAKVTLTSTNANSNPALQSDLLAERRDLAKRGLGVMVQVGAAYAF